MDNQHGMTSRAQRGREKIRTLFEDCCEIAVDCRGRVVECEPRALSARVKGTET